MKKNLIVFLIWINILGNLEAQTKPMPLPENFDYDLYMVANEVNGEKFHGPRESVRLCEKLLDNGTPEDIRNTEKIIPGILSGQVQNPDSSHYGGYRWELEMEEVEDFNAVEFILHSLIPILILHEDKLADSTSTAIRKSIKLGLRNIAQMNVGLKYTNIALKDIANSCLGGELLNDSSIAERGYKKMEEWMAFTDNSGSTYEYNSTPYTVVAIEVLYRLQKYVQHEPTRVRAKLALERIGLGVALRMHEPTGRWSGAKGRAYHSYVLGNSDSARLKSKEIISFRDWLDEGKISSWLGSILDGKYLPSQIVATHGRDEGIFTATFLDEKFSLGVASRNMANQANRYIAWQSNVYVLQYKRPEEQVGTIFTRYLTNDHWLGDFSPGIGRGNSHLLPDEGHFQGIQDRERAIGLYIPQSMGALEHYSSAKTVIAITNWATKDEVWIDGRQEKQFPITVSKDKTIVFRTGSILLGIKPFSLTNLGSSPQVKIDMMPNNTLVLELYNYKGQAKTFWELAWPGTFYQGQPQNGFYSEVADSESISPSAFTQLINRGKITDEVGEKMTYTGKEKRPWKVGYESDGRSLLMEVDLFDWSKPTKQIINGKEIEMPKLQSENAIESDSGQLTLGNVKLNCGKNTAWLYVSPDGQTAVAAYHGPVSASLELTLPKGFVKLPSLSAGIVIWDHGKVSVDALDLKGEISVKGGKLKK